MAELILTIEHEAGLHARPLAKFVKIVKAFDATVEVTNLTNGKGPVSGASPLKLMLLGVVKCCDIKIVSGGPQAEEVLQALQALIEKNFGEG